MSNSGSGSLLRYGNEKLPDNNSLVSLLPKPKNNIRKDIKEDANEQPESKERDLVSRQTAVAPLEKYKAIARMGHSGDRLIQTDPTDMQPKYFALEDLARPSAEQVTHDAESTKRALELILVGWLVGWLVTLPA